MTSENLLKQVGTDRPVSPEKQPTSPDNRALLDKAATEMLLLGLKTLSQRTVVALGQLFTLLTCVSAFVLWQDTLPNPNSYQLVGLGLYGAFILLLHLIRRK